jgi:hypothetical protein
MDDQITQAIRDKRLVSFQYHGYSRIGEPHVFGRNKGIKQLEIFQTGGGSSSGNLPEWRRMNLSEITGFAVLLDTFSGRRENPSGKHSSWDEIFIVVS